MTNSKQKPRSKSGECHWAEVGGSLNPQKTQGPPYISDPITQAEHAWNPISINNRFVVRWKKVLKWWGNTLNSEHHDTLRAEFTTPPIGGLISEEMTTLVHSLT